jgi:hypothetical protein
MHRGDRAGEIEDLIHLDVERHGNVVSQYLEARIGQQMFDVLPPPGVIIVDAKNLVACGEKPFTQMRTNESRAARDECTRS